MRFSRQEYWSGLLCPSPGDLPSPQIESTCLTFPVLAGRYFSTSSTIVNTYYSNVQFPAKYHKAGKEIRKYSTLKGKIKSIETVPEKDLRADILIKTFKQPS